MASFGDILYTEEISIVRKNISVDKKIYWEKV